MSSNIHQEVSNRNVKRLYVFIKEGHDLDSRDMAENTPLHIAVAKGYDDIVEILLDYEVDVDASNSFGWTPVMQAAREGHTKIVEMLIDFGADIYATNKYGLSSLTLSAASGCLEIFCNLAKELSWGNDAYKSSLEVAALYGHHDIVKFLLDRGFDASSTLNNGITSLECATVGGNLRTVNLLLNRGADPKLKNCGNYTAFDVASVHNNNEVLELLKKYEQRWDTRNDQHLDIFDAIIKGNVARVEEILSMTPSAAQMVAEDGSTTLMVAAVVNNIAIARLLLKYKVEVNAQELNKGMTPIMQGVYNRDVEMTKLLLEAGANSSIKNNDGFNAIDIAMKFQKPEIIKLLYDSQKHATPDKQCFHSKSSALRQKSLKVKEFFNNIFKRETSNASPNDRNETFRRNCLLDVPPSLIHCDPHQGMDDYFHNNYLDFGASSKNISQPIIDDGDCLKKGTFIYKKRHSLPEFKPLRVKPESTSQQCQRSPETRTDNVCAASKTFVTEQKLELTKKVDDAKKSPINECSCAAAAAAATPSEYDLWNLKAKYEENERCNSFQKEECFFSAEDSEFDSIESIRERIRIRRRILGYNENDLDVDPYVILRNKGYVEIEGAVEALKLCMEGKVLVCEN